MTHICLLCNALHNRHTAVTLLISQNVDAKLISGRTGHANIGTTYDIYGHMLKSKDKEAAEKIDQFLNTAKTERKKGQA